MINLETIKAMTMGIAVADAVGVPVEFKSRETLKRKPVTDMFGFGSHNQPVGTWSDDTSLTIATMESIARQKRIDYVDLMNNFALWYFEGKFTARGEVFDCGGTTLSAIIKYVREKPLEDCGSEESYSNGNGSLMRILPVAVYLHSVYGKNFDERAMLVIHEVSALTHAHPRSMVGCGIYSLIAVQLLGGKSIPEAIQIGLGNAEKYYSGSCFTDELEKYSRLWREDFANLPEEEIKSTGYVVDTLEAALWCLLNTKDYKALVLKAVNLGD
ncbi:MAG: ADP-ribosylglycohydrolase family protein, partial [Methanobrevibacter sp.]|uniref:ADP-ribosylglycohydrolase family protein n=1 Tax=Methanobrevibacter sp. TaxID=66852 RepID=UPI0025F00F65